MAAGINARLTSRRSSAVRGSFRISMEIHGANQYTNKAKMHARVTDKNMPHHKYNRGCFAEAV